MSVPDPTASVAPHLKRRVGLVGVTMFGAGTAIGVSIFSVLAPAAKVAGSGLLVAVAIAALPMILFAIVYAFMSSALPKSGASYEWPRRFLHPGVGFMIAWLRILANVGAMLVLSSVLVSYLKSVIDLPQKPAVAALITSVFVLNWLGVAVAARVQTLLMLALLCVLGLFVGFGAPHVRLETIGPLTARGWPAIAAAAPLMISLFLGIESAAEIGEEVHDAPRIIPLGIALAVIMTAIVYLAVAATALGLVGPERLARSGAPLLEAAKGPMGRLAVPLILGAASVSILKSLNSTALVFSRSIFAMGRSGALPASVGSVHPRFGTPQGALLFSWAFAMLGLLLPSGLTFLLLAVNIPTMLKYMASSFCAVRIALGFPEVYARAIVRPSRPMLVIVGLAAILVGGGIIAAGWNADWRPYALTGAWGVLGLIYWVVDARRRERAPEAE